MAFDWYYDSDVATIPSSNGKLLGLGTMAHKQALGQGSAHMIQSLQIIYNRLYQALPRSDTYDDLDTSQVIRFLELKEKIDPRAVVYRDLCIEVCKLRVQKFSPAFIERFCLAKLCELILAEYAINVAEAYALAYITLNKPTDLNHLHFKLGTSGLIAPAMINGEHIQDVEAISHFMVSALRNAELLTISDERWVKPGKKFILMM